MKKILAQIFFYLTILILIFILATQYILNGNNFVIPFFIALGLYLVFYTLYGVISGTFAVSKKDYRNESLYVITRSIICILILVELLLSVWKIELAGYVGSLLLILLTSMMYVDKKQTQQFRKGK
ncbi:hypothetical protein [Clostridium manihotivorum]|uniref:Uncharacterized protein n=1 Tax=Clostridium manihotivorum TaxID=2320868 RepID=A0A410DWI5_9CLOT|nr:hypothetical protein [Clostridium manihotivorum]QAA33444.1 hypothetical protein C1I91_18325 [Clostridium manihotivorum]